MNGQWIGKYTGTNTGHVTLNLELIGNEYRGIAVLNDHSSSPSFTVAINFTSTNN